MTNPPPIPHSPAGFFKRSLACIADVILLMLLGYFLANFFAGPEELAAYEKSQAWMNRFNEQYVKTLNSGNPKDFGIFLNMTSQILSENNPDGEAIRTFYTYQAHVCFFTILIALSLQEWLLAGRTLGKSMFNLQTINLPEGASPTFLSALLRSAWKAAFFALPSPIFMILGIVNFHVPLFRRDKRAWHDLFSRTQVITVKAL